MNQNVKLVELSQLAVLASEGVIDTDGLECLEKLLHDDPAAQRTYFQLVELNVGLAWRGERTRPIAGEHLTSSALSPAVDGVESIFRSDLTPHSLEKRTPAVALGALQTVGRSLLASPIGVTLLVAGLIYGSFGLFVWQMSQYAPRADRATEVLAQPAWKSGGPAIARLIATEGCRWSEGATAYPAGSSLEPGVLQLAAGTALLTFNDGASVVCEGPTQFELLSPRGGFLHRGKLTARVPKRAAGFTVHTPTAKVIDLGTEFGVEVDDRGTAEVHVFQGRVVAEWASKKSPSSQRVELQASEAARFAAGDTTVSKLSAAPERFRRTMSAESTAMAAVPVQPDSGRGLQLWLKADAGVYSHFSDDGDFFNDIVTTMGDAVSAWRDFSGQNRRALQSDASARPQLQRGERQAAVLRFDGDDDWLGRPGTVLTHEDASSFTALVVFNLSKVAGYGRIFGQLNDHPMGPSSRMFYVDRSQGNLFAYDEFPPSSGALQGPGTRVVTNQTYIAGVRRSGDIACHLFLLSDAGAAWTGPEVPENYRSTYGVSTEWRIGSMRQGITSLQFFNGDIAELVIFDRALSPTELSNVQKYLIAKYLRNQVLPNQELPQATSQPKSKS